METEHQIERILGDLDSRAPFAGLIHSTCILGAAYRKPADLARAIRRRKISSPKGYFTQSDQQEGNQCQLHGHIQVYVQ